jgi:HSP20 family molecular chaperone IbpA
MPPLPRSRPEFLPGEDIILSDQGGFRQTHRAGWRPVECFLTNRRLILFLRPEIRFQVPLENIVKLHDEKHYYVLKTRPTLRITYDREKGPGIGKVLFVTNRIHIWKQKILQLCFLNVDFQTLEKIAGRLDVDGRDILWYLWEKGHARINELAELIEAPNHMHVLLVIRDTINPVAEKEVGCSVLSFERQKVDPDTGETILFSWWLVGKKECFLPNRERLVDIFDEGDQIRVIMEVKGISAEDLRLDFNGERITVRCHKIGASLRVELPLGAPVSPTGYALRIRNNLLEIRFNKDHSS